MPDRIATTGLPELDDLIGGITAGDNIVLEADSGAPVDRFVSSYIQACAKGGAPLVYVSFNRSPQTITEAYSKLMMPGDFRLVDCFSSGKGNSDEMFLDFFKSAPAGARAIHVDRPSDPASLHEALARLAQGGNSNAYYVFDSLTGMLDLWGDEETVVRFFGHMCPRLFDLNAVAYWLLEREAHTQRALAKVQHITQVVIEVAIAHGVPTLTVRKAANRECGGIGVPQRLAVTEGKLELADESREDRELALLTALGETLGSALEPRHFFEQTMAILAEQLGMLRGTLVLLDRTSGKLRIAAAHGLSEAERLRGEYAVGEGITGHVVQTGRPQVVADIREDPRFLDRTAARRVDRDRPVAFICVPLKIDEEIVGALSADRPFAAKVTLAKDLRLLTIVASTVSQVLKINRMIHVEKEQILGRNEELLKSLREKYRLDNVAGQSASMQKVLASAAAAAKSEAPILITGETGTGKELIANVVHYNSGRADGPFVKVNCGALPETLLESELFGHVRGSFTGAIRDRKGRFELADGGTLFLDEVAEMSPRLQVKLLRVLQDMEFEPVGGDKTLRVDVRVVAATNKDLRKGIREATFREDLYYRLNVIPVHLPPLRDRREDIPPLVDHFLDLYNRRNAKNVSKLSREVLDLLLSYSWPGNIRELENTIERAVVMSPGEVLSADLLPAEIAEPGARGGGPPAGDALRRQIAQYCAANADIGAVLRQLGAAVEEAVLRRAQDLGLSQREMALRLDMSRMTLRKKLREYRLL